MSTLERGGVIAAIVAGTCAWGSVLIWAPAIVASIVTVALAIGWSVWIDHHPSA